MITTPKIIDAEIVVSLHVPSAINEKELELNYDGNLHQFILELVDEEGLFGVTDETYHILGVFDVSKRASSARLFSTAPELLEVLKDSHKLLAQQWDIESNIVRREALANQMDVNLHLIAKAEGRP